LSHTLVARVTIAVTIITEVEADYILCDIHCAYRIVFYNWDKVCSLWSISWGWRNSSASSIGSIGFYGYHIFMEYNMNITVDCSGIHVDIIMITTTTTTTN